MSQINSRIIQILTAFTMLGLIMFSGYGVLYADRDNLSKAVFFVTWYDVGQAALEGLDGVKKITKGFRGFKEINTVYYDPAVISIAEMEAALKNAGTYLGTAK